MYSVCLVLNSNLLFFLPVKLYVYCTSVWELAFIPKRVIHTCLNKGAISHQGVVTFKWLIVGTPCVRWVKTLSPFKEGGGDTSQTTHKMALFIHIITVCEVESFKRPLHNASFQLLHPRVGASIGICASCVYTWFKLVIASRPQGRAAH